MAAPLRHARRGGTAAALRQAPANVLAAVRGDLMHFALLRSVAWTGNAVNEISRNPEGLPCRLLAYGLLAGLSKRHIQAYP